MIRKHWPLLIILIIFIAFKIPHLFYPFYWDESWPYATGVYKMYLHGPSLMPGAIDGWLSRGHPLFFHAAAALWMKLFGSSHPAMHAFSLFVSVVMIISVYGTGLSLFNKRVAIIAAMLLASYVMFFVQSAFLLPEIMLALLAFLSLRFYVTEKYLLTAVFLTALFYTKESGLIVGFIIGCDAFLNLFNRGKTLRERLLALLSVSIPALLIGIFFLLQKHISGWYVLPMYTTFSQELTWPTYYHTFKIYLHCLFYNKFLYYYYAALIVLSVLIAFSYKKYKYLFLLPAGLMVYLTLDDSPVLQQHSLLTFISLTLSLLLTLLTFCGRRYFKQLPGQKFLFLAALIAIIYTYALSGFDFIIYRYLFVALILSFFWLAVIFDKMVTDTNPLLFYAILLFIVYTAQHAFRHDDDRGDSGLKAFDAMKVHQGVIDYLEKKNAYDQWVSSGLYLERVHLQEPASGFLRSAKSFPHVTWGIDSNTRYVVYDNIEYDKGYSDLLNKEVINNPHFPLVYRIEKAGIWAEIYERK